jgi:hypothetical protein
LEKIRKETGEALTQIIILQDLNQNDGNFWKVLSESEPEKILSNFPNFFTAILYTGKAIAIFKF